MIRTARSAALLLTLFVAAPAVAQDVLDLPLGDPSRRDLRWSPRIDVLLATADATEITPTDLAERLRDVRLLLIGESHTSIDFHRVQERVVRALQDAGRRVLVGLEMYPATEQPSLDRWNAGDWSEDEFVLESGWYRHWSYNWGYYREIFLTARRGGSPLYALNAPRSSVSAVRRKGFDGLSDEERVGMPPGIDVDDEEHLTLFKSYFGDDADGTHGGMTDEQWQAMFAAQVTWDGAMAWNAVQRLQEDPDPQSIMVVLVGSGHVAYELGIARQAAAWFDGEIATLIPVPVRDDEGQPVDAVRLSYADFLWGIPGEQATLYPSLGVSVTEAEGELRVLFADPDSLGGAGGISAGDRIVAVDGREIPDKPTWHRLLADKRWGDDVTITIERAGERLDLVLILRRDPTAGH